MGVILVPGVPNPVPLAPILVSPANGTYEDLTGTPTFQWEYQPGAPGNTQSAWQFLLIINGGATAQYWNTTSSAFQSTPVWNSGSNQSYTFPTGAFSDGNVYQWSVATQDSNGNGPAAAYFTVNAQQAPTVTVSAPSGIITTADPLVSWSVALPGASGALPAPTQTSYRVIIYDNSQYSASGFTPGSGPSIYDTGQVGSAYINSLDLSTIPLFLADGTQYRAYVQVTETGGQYSTWAYSSFTTNYAAPNTPTVTAVAGTDPTTGCPLISVSVQCNDNLLSAQDAISPVGSGTGTWSAGSNTTLGSGNSPDNTYGLSLTATATGNISGATGSGTGGYAVVAGRQYTAVANVRPAVGGTARSFTVAMVWTDSLGNPLSTSTGAVFSESLTQWTQGSVTATAPTNAAYVQVVVTVDSAATSEKHWYQKAGVLLFASTTWGAGGFVGLQQLMVLRSDGLYVRGASIANPASVNEATQLLTLSDYEAIQQEPYTYQGIVLVTYGANQSVISEAGTSSQVTLVTNPLRWWELDPTDPSTAVSAQLVDWAPVQTEQSTAHAVAGATVLTMVANTMLSSDFTGKAETFDDATSRAFNALCASQKTIFVNSPWGIDDSGYFRIGPQTGGMSTGVGNQARQNKLMPSVYGAGHRTISVSAIAQRRPNV